MAREGRAVRRSGVLTGGPGPRLQQLGRPCHHHTAGAEPRRQQGQAEHSSDHRAPILQAGLGCAVLAHPRASPRLAGLQAAASCVAAQADWGHRAVQGLAECHSHCRQLQRCHVQQASVAVRLPSELPCPWLGLRLTLAPLQYALLTHLTPAAQHPGDFLPRPGLPTAPGPALLLASCGHCPLCLLCGWCLGQGA